MLKTGLLIGLALVCSSGAFAQAVAGYGAITGIVIDPYGDGIPDTTVVIYNDALGVKRTLNTSDDGIFDAVALIPSTGYGIKISRKNYTRWQTGDIEVVVGRTLVFKIYVKKAEDKTTELKKSGMTVVDGPAISLSTMLTPDELLGLPIQSRKVEPLVDLAPMVTTDRSKGTLAFRGEGFTNAVYTNGIDTTYIYSMNSPDIAPQLTPDVVESVNVISAVAPAEFGRTAGGTLNLATHTGENGLHGTAYDYYSGSGWNAANRYAPAFKPQLKANQIGASVAGAAVPNTLFFFGNFEAQNSSSYALNRISNPQFMNSSFTAVSSSACTTTASLCTAAGNFVNSQANAVISRSQRNVVGFARVDYQREDNDRFSVEVNALHRNAPNGLVNQEVGSNGGLLGGNGNLGEDTRYLQIGWTRALSSSMYNEAHVGWYRNRLSEMENPSLLPSTGLLGINVAGTSLGANSSLPQTISEQHASAVDHFTLTSFSHTLKLGVEYTRSVDWIYQLANARGTYDYSTFTNFANDFSSNTRSLKNYADYTQGYFNWVTKLHSGYIAGFAQDTWKATQSLTLVAGLRYEKWHNPVPPLTNTNYYLTCCIPSPNMDISPRVGASYMITPHTVIRAGFGFFYQPYSPELLDALYDGNGTSQGSIYVNPSQSGAPVFPNTVLGTAIPANTRNIIYASQKLRNPYTGQVNLALETQIAKGTTLTINALESRSYKMWTALDANLTSSVTTKTYLIYNASNVQTGTFSTLLWSARDGAYAHIWEIDNEGSARYAAANAQLRQRLWHNLTMQATFTWSHAIDDVSGPSAVAGVPQNTYPGNYRNDQGNSAFDQRFRGVIGFTYETKFVPLDSKMHWVVNGWQLSAIGTFGSTMYATPTVLVNGQQFTSSTAASVSTMTYTTSMNGTGGWSRVPFQGIGTLPIGKQHTVDIRAARTFQASERMKVTFLVEAFNALNSQYNTSVNTLAYIATGSILRPVANVGTGNAASGFPYGTNARQAQAGIRVSF